MNIEGALPSHTERSTARGLYTWLMLLALLGGIFACLPFSTYDWAPGWLYYALFAVQAIGQLLLMLGFLSRSSFVRWHTAQVLALSLLSTFLGIVWMAGQMIRLRGSISGDFVPVFVNWVYWMLVAFVGERQARRGVDPLQHLIGRLKSIDLLWRHDRFTLLTPLALSGVGLILAFMLLTADWYASPSAENLSEGLVLVMCCACPFGLIYVLSIFRVLTKLTSRPSETSGQETANITNDA